MYKEQVVKIVDRFGGYREREILSNPHTIEKSGTWNNEHKVLNVCGLIPDEDGRKDSFQIDIIAMSICG